MESNLESKTVDFPLDYSVFSLVYMEILLFHHLLEICLNHRACRPVYKVADSQGFTPWLQTLPAGHALMATGKVEPVGVLTLWEPLSAPFLTRVTEVLCN